MYKSKAAYALVLFIPLILAGCIEYDQEIIIKEDGSGTVKIHYNNSAQDPIEEGAGLVSDAVPRLPFSEEEIIESYEFAPVIVEDIKLETIDGKPNASYCIFFYDIEDLNGTGIFYLEEGQLTQAFSLQEEEGIWTYAQTIDLYWPVEDQAGSTDYSFTYRAEVPGEIIESNGARGPNNTVRWEYTLAELLNKETTLTVKYTISEPLPIIGTVKKFVRAAEWVMGLCFLCALIAIPILLALQKRDKFLFMNAVIKALEKGLVLKKVVGVVLIVLAVLIVLYGVLAFLSLWSEGTEMAGLGLWQYATFAYIIVISIIIYMMAHAAVMRAAQILKLPESEYIIIPIVSKVVRLGGEILACSLLALAILFGGVALLLLTTGEAASIFPRDDLAAYAVIAVSFPIVAFASLMASYLVAELLTAFGAIADDAKSLRKAGRNRKK